MNPRLVRTLAAVAPLAGAVLLAGPSPEAQAADVDVQQSVVLRLEAVGDRAAMASMTVGVPVDWTVGVSAARPDGRIRSDIVIDATPDRFAVEIGSCTIAWGPSGCGGTERLVVAGPLVSGVIDVGEQDSADQRWYRIRMSYLGGADGGAPPEAHVTFRAAGLGDSASVTPGPTAVGSEGGSLPRTAIGVASGAAIGAIVAVLIGLVTVAKRRRTEGAQA